MFTKSKLCNILFYGKILNNLISIGSSFWCLVAGTLDCFFLAELRMFTSKKLSIGTVLLMISYEEWRVICCQQSLHIVTVARLLTMLLIYDETSSCGRDLTNCESLLFLQPTILERILPKIFLNLKNWSLKISWTRKWKLISVFSLDTQESNIFTKRNHLA